VRSAVAHPQPHGLAEQSLREDHQSEPNERKHSLRERVRAYREVARIQPHDGTANAALDSPSLSERNTSAPIEREHSAQESVRSAVAHPQPHGLAEQSLREDHQSEPNERKHSLRERVHLDVEHRPLHGRAEETLPEDHASAPAQPKHSAPKRAPIEVPHTRLHSLAETAAVDPPFPRLKHLQRVRDSRVAAHTHGPESQPANLPTTLAQQRQIDPGTAATMGTIVVVKRSNSRRVQNHDQMVHTIASLYPHHRVVVYDDQESISVLQLAQLFHQADLIVAPHGAGLVNMMACRPGTVVMEFVPIDGNSCFMNLAAQLGILYVGIGEYTASDNTFFVQLRHLREVLISLEHLHSTGQLGDEVRLLART